MTTFRMVNAEHERGRSVDATYLGRAHEGDATCWLKSMGYDCGWISWITASPLELDGADVRSRLHFVAVRGCVKVAGDAEGYCLARGLINNPQTVGEVLTLSC